MNTAGLLNEFAAAFEEKSMLKHLITLKHDRTPRTCFDTFLTDGVSVPLDNDLYVAFKIENRLDLPDIIDIAASTLALFFDRLITANVHRLPMWSRYWSWDTWLDVKRHLGGDVTMLLTPESETDMLKSFHPGINNLDNFYVSMSLPACSCGRVYSTIIDEVSDHNMAFTVKDGPRVGVGQCVEINGLVYSIIDAEYETRAQKLFTDRRFAARKGDIARFSGIGRYNLALKKDAITVVTCPAKGSKSIVENGLCYSIQEKDGILVFRLLMGTTISNPDNTVVIIG